MNDVSSFIDDEDWVRAHLSAAEAQRDEALADAQFLREQLAAERARRNHLAGYNPVIQDSDGECFCVFCHGDDKTHYSLKKFKHDATCLWVAFVSASTNPAVER